MGVAEVDTDPGVDTDAGMSGHLEAVVPGQGTPQVAGQGLDFRGHGLSDHISAAVLRQVQQLHEPSAAFDQGADLGGLIFADDQIALRKTVNGPGEPGMAEVALRCGR